MLNEQQEFIKNKAINWWNNSSKLVFQYTGGPGTGKTYLLKHILQNIQVPYDRIAPMAYTGQAAVVMRSYGLQNAKTIHSWLYEPVEEYELNPDGTYKLDPYFNKPIPKLKFVPRDLDGIDLFIIDEGSMVPIEMKNEIESRGKKIIVTGDIDQLPPIYGQSAYFIDGDIYRLTEIMRQKKNSPIVYLSKLALNGIDIECGRYGNCKVLYEDELTDYEIISSDIMICGKNETRNMINDNYRHNILRCKSTLPLQGERMVCRKNNWHIACDGINLVNGLIGHITKSAGVKDFDGKTYKIDFLPLMTNTIFHNLSCDYKYLVEPMQREILKNNKFSKGEKMEYAYAITTYMSQGGQFNNGIYVAEKYLRNDIQCRSDYTAITRFKNSVIIVKKRPRIYYNINY